MYSKYRAIKTTIDGITFDSKKEAIRYQELKLLERCNKITDLKRQVPFVLIPKNTNGSAVKYIADFTYKRKSGIEVVEDVKGVKTPVYRLKKRLMKEVHGIDIYES